MVRSANRLWTALAVAPALLLGIATVLTFGGTGFATGQTFVLVLFFTLLIVSASDVGLTVYIQMRSPIMGTRAAVGPVGRIFLNLATGSVLSEAHAIYGLILTLLSGSIVFAIGFSLVTWASLFWVRKRFKQNLAKLPDAAGIV